MEVKRFSIGKGLQGERPVIRVNRDKGDCWISISDGEVKLTAYLSDTELEQLIVGDFWIARLSMKRYVLTILQHGTIN